MVLDMYLYFIFMFLSSVFVFIMSIFYYYLNFSLGMEWMLMSVNSFNMEVFILLDWISLIFLSVVLMISSMVMIYSTEYMSGDGNISRFFNLINLFVMSMILMIISPNILSILFGWDGLGVSSYCLVIYYQNYMSYNSGMVTILINRVGDIGILMAISMMLMYGSWGVCMLLKSKFILLMLILASVTKSAQIPFSSWLPMAMAAPTPVSSLVHSSTLVTAGVYLMIRLSFYLHESGISDLLMFLSVLTMFMSGLMANYEMDLKKIIALSTLSQLGLMMMSLSAGFKLLCFYHLLTHALFKSMLFLCAGILIHSMNNTQDIRKYGNLMENFPYTMMSFFIASFALCGFPFLAGFYSKDLIMEVMYDSSMSSMMFILALLSLMFTVSYSLRLFYYLFFGEMKFNSFIKMGESNMMNMSMIILIFFSVIGGAMLNWLFFFDCSAFLQLELKVLTLVMCLGGIMLWGLVSWFFVSVKFLYFLSSMWLMNYLYTYLNKPILEFALFLNKTEKTWLEYISKQCLWGMMYSIFYSKEVYSLSYKIFMFVLFLLSLLLILMMIY